MKSDSVLEDLIVAFTMLPGIGHKSAVRMSYHLLQKNRPGGKSLAKAIEFAMDSISCCSSCRNFTTSEVCVICSQSKRDKSILCIVENPIDVLLIEQIGLFNGLYFVLMGHLSPLDGIGAYELGMPLLRSRVLQGGVKEMIIATNATVEGSATANYIKELTSDLKIKITRISHGLPAGSELEYVDSTTLACALMERKELN
ncbi:MAG: recombination mediator RecR [Methylacidiphilales bacterium]|nr:recombination mediator RecR [Candidatus Methylacidiphilales bacterium]